jgi:hypothetical protein
MKMEECCGATNVCDECPEDECCKATNAEGECASTNVAKQRISSRNASRMSATIFIEIESEIESK